MNEKGLQKESLGDGLVLYPDCGGGYTNIYRYGYLKNCTHAKMSILLYINLKIKIGTSFNALQLLKPVHSRGLCAATTEPTCCNY